MELKAGPNLETRVTSTLLSTYCASVHRHLCSNISEDWHRFLACRNERGTSERGSVLLRLHRLGGETGTLWDSVRYAAQLHLFPRQPYCATLPSALHAYHHPLWSLSRYLGFLRNWWHASLALF